MTLERVEVVESVFDFLRKALSCIRVEDKSQGMEFGIPINAKSGLVARSL